MPFFSKVITNYGSDVAHKWYNELKYEFFPKGSTIFHFGELGTKFYIIIKGKVSWKIPQIKEIVSKDKNFKNWRDFLGEDDKRCTTYEELRTKNAYKLMSTTSEGMFVFSAKVLEQVAVFEDGTAFGEVAILQLKPRTATMDCIEDTHLAVLDK